MFPRRSREVARRLGSPLIGALLSVLTASCANGLDQSSPEGVARLFVHAIDRGRVDEFLAILPPDEKLASSFDCGHADTLKSVFMRKRDEARAELAARKAAGHQMRLHRFDGEGSKTTELSQGDLFEGCTVLRPLTVHRSKVTASLAKGGSADRDTETWTFLRFEPEGPWYFARH
jgi:hypothetical protein